MFCIVMLLKEEKEEILPLLFDLLNTNMCEIAPTGNTYEQDFEIWKNKIYPALEHKARQIILIKKNDRIVGFFQYYINETTFMMEEIQFNKDYWGSGIFKELYQYLAKIIPEDISLVEAYSNKKNYRSQKILNHLGLENVGESLDKEYYHFRGNCQEMLARYRYNK